MKMLKSIVRPNKVDEVKDALAKLNITGMTVTEVRDAWPQDYCSASSSARACAAAKSRSPE